MSVCLFILIDRYPRLHPNDIEVRDCLPACCSSVANFHLDAHRQAKRLLKPSRKQQVRDAALIVLLGVCCFFPYLALSADQVQIFSIFVRSFPDLDPQMLPVFRTVGHRHTHSPSSCSTCKHVQHRFVYPFFLQAVAIPELRGSRRKFNTKSTC